jgi:hypothetical protein
MSDLCKKALENAAQAVNNQKKPITGETLEKILSEEGGYMYL